MGDISVEWTNCWACRVALMVERTPNAASEREGEFGAAGRAKNQLAGEHAFTTENMVGRPNERS